MVRPSQSSDLPRASSTQDAESELRRLHRLRLLGGLVDGIVHDFRNALGSVVGFLDLQLASATDPAQRATLARADTSIGDVLRLLRVVTRLAVTRGRAAQRIALAELAADAHSLLVTRARHRGITLQVVDDASGACVFAVPGDALGLIVQLGLHALSAAAPDDSDARLVISTCDEGSRSYGVIAWQVSGDPADDRELREWAADPSRGFAGVRAGTHAEGELTTSLAALVIAGGRLEVGTLEIDGVRHRSLAVCLPCAAVGSGGAAS